jgi:multiple sugar transport system ATP-binding protein
VAYGVRPENLALAGADATLRGDVIVVEPTGAETELLLKVGAAQVLMVVHGRTAAKPGERVGLAVDTAAVHLFDPASGRALSRQPEAAAA